NVDCGRTKVTKRKTTRIDRRRERCGGRASIEPLPRWSSRDREFPGRLLRYLSRGRARTHGSRVFRTPFAFAEAFLGRLEVVMGIQFGEHTFDGVGRQVRRGAEETPLRPKGFELLRLLIDARPRALSKDELIDRLWPDAFVSEASLAGLVTEIR